MGNYFTIISTAIIVLFAVGFGVVIFNKKRKNLLFEDKHFLESLPSIISTLGVLGTFLGITLGLMGFNSNDLDHSIPKLLDGLKTAFFTSLAGMLGSLILSRILSHLYDEAEKGVSDINNAAREITEAVSKMSESIVNNANKQADIQAAFYNNINTVVGSLATDVQLQKSSIVQMLTLCTNISTTTQGMSKVVFDLKTSVDAQHDSVKELSTVTESIFNTQTQLAENVDKIAPALHDEVLEIEESMSKTNVLLENKFNEFTELLKKSNTEALVEVMKQVTAEFQKQMNDLISKLVQENFEQLNKSVEKLNTWQMENKEMIQRLTDQYQTMATNFESTSNSLSSVEKDTKLLVSDGGKLSAIVNALNTVMVDDKKFIEISRNLENSADSSRAANESLKDSTESLENWLEKQKEFRESVDKLITKLHEISKINDYSAEFWANTRQGMDDSVDIIKDGSDRLNRQITALDGHFYDRLNQTLANLDNCITKMAEHYINRR